MPTRRSYPNEFKARLELVEELVRAGRTPESLLKELDPYGQTICSWVPQTAWLGQSAVPGKEHSELELSAHLAEYAALTNRCTYWIAMQYAVWPVMGALLAFAASLWSTVDHSVLIWTSIAAILMLLLGWNSSLREIYNAVRYMERELRPAIQEIIGQHLVWRYETYNALQRGAFPVWWEYATPAAFFVALIALTVLRSFVQVDAVGLAANTCLLVGTTVQTMAIIRIRRDFFPSPLRTSA